jgi:hypothetical protein
MDWIQFSLFLISMAGMFLWQRTESRSDLRELRADAAADRRDIMNLIKEIKDEMKDFHGRLERQDAEFRGRMERQDAEFKAHIMYFHDERNRK